MTNVLDVFDKKLDGRAWEDEKVYEIGWPWWLAEQKDFVGLIPRAEHNNESVGERWEFYYCAHACIRMAEMPEGTPEDDVNTEPVRETGDLIDLVAKLREIANDGGLVIGYKASAVLDRLKLLIAEEADIISYQGEFYEPKVVAALPENLEVVDVPSDGGHYALGMDAALAEAAA